MANEGKKENKLQDNKLKEDKVIPKKDEIVAKSKKVDIVINEKKVDIVKKEKKIETIKKVLITEFGKRFFVRNVEQDFHTNFGVVSKKDLKSDASIIKTGNGTKLFAHKPAFIDLYSRIKRAPQIIPRKDIGIIIAETGIGRNSIVVEAGTGSGALCFMLANIVKKVFTYEIREDFFNIASENLKFLGLKNVVMNNKSIYDRIDEKKKDDKGKNDFPKDVDLVALDLPEPWLAVENANALLKSGGFLVSYSPTTPQVSDFVEKVKKIESLRYIKTVEVIMRDWEIDERKVRPMSASIGHSGFISFVRKV
ncbi:TPA: methyltransferase domain-containing protein [Candidatus Woesearchaeota archaeon]|nr:methyltransferase domain-containing protein [Candidatus Woesearchaeota archaeon]